MTFLFKRNIQERIKSDDVAGNPRNYYNDNNVQKRFHHHLYFCFKYIFIDQLLRITLSN